MRGIEEKLGKDEYAALIREIENTQLVKMKQPSGRTGGHQ
jgi:hypothetical protein